jgi:hypothetical protein
MSPNQNRPAIIRLNNNITPNRVQICTPKNIINSIRPVSPKVQYVVRPHLSVLSLTSPQFIGLNTSLPINYTIIPLIDSINLNNATTGHSDPSLNKTPAPIESASKGQETGAKFCSSCLVPYEIGLHYLSSSSK